MPAGVGGNQPNDALTAAKLLTATVDTHQLMSALQRLGVSFASAQQFSVGEAVTNETDRLALARLLSELFKLSGTLP
jgi:hypothetical protein